MPSLDRWSTFVRNAGLWPRLAFVIAVGFIIFFTIFSLLSLRMVNDSTRRILNERQVLTQMAADEIDALLAQGFHELEKATTFARFDPQADNLEEEYHMLAHAYGRIGTLSLGVYFYSATGKIILIEPYDALMIGADHSAESHVRQVIESGQRSVSAPFLDPGTGAPAVALTIPIRNEQGQLISMLSGLIDLSNPDIRRPIDQALNLGHTGHAELVDSQGNIVVSTYPGVFLQPGEHATFYRKMMAESLVGVETVPYEHGEGETEIMHIMAFAPLSTVDWGVSMGGDATETFAPVVTLRNSLFLLGGLMLVVILTATLIGTRRLVRPVNILIRSAQGIAKGDLTSAIQLSEGGEIGLLGRSLEEMRLRLKGSIDEIQKWNQELEQRVKHRTKELEELYRQLQKQNKERSVLLKKIITAQEEERMRIARELHDDVGPALAGLVISLGGAEDLLDLDSDIRRQLESLRGLTSEALEEIRRMIRDLRPSLLDDLGLVAAVAWYVENYLIRTGVKTKMETQGFDRKLPSAVEITLFRVVQEAITNIIKHAHAKTACIRLQLTPSSIVGSIDDDGVGFNMITLHDKKHTGMAVGLLGMEERIILLEGKLSIESQPRGGTHVHFEIPWQESNGEENSRSYS